jgi:hypothetical protein
MSFQPIIVGTGYSAWRFLQQTLPQQSAAFEKSAELKREADYFRQQIGSVETASELMADPRLLRVALTAFGLEGDVPNRAFIEKILSDGTLDEKAFANRLADKRYSALSKAFGFGDFDTPRTQLSDFADNIVSRYLDRRFETAIGEQNGDLRLALSAGAGITDVITGNRSDRARWFAIMGNAPLRRVVETALGLPSSIGKLDLDQQFTQFQDRAQAVLGRKDAEALADPEIQEKVIRLFLVRTEASNLNAASGGSVALSLLQSMPRLNALG